MKRIAVLFSLLAMAACDSATGLGYGAITYSIVSVNNQSPDAAVPIGFTQYRVSIPRASLILRPDGTVEERMQYVITHQSNDTRIAATDTTFGNYVEHDGVFDIRMPDANGTELYAGTGQEGAGGLVLSRSWRKEGVLVTADIAYYRSN